MNISEPLGVPLGTIIASTLNYPQLCKVSGDGRAPSVEWNASTSVWAPCDGRSAAGSKYGEITQRVSVPDLRGVFLRATNEFDPNWNRPVPEPQRDPETRKPESFQGDAIRKHAHDLAGNTMSSGYLHGHDKYDGGGDWPRWVPTPHTITVQDTGQNLDGAETRPKNVAVCYYIRIN